MIVVADSSPLIILAKLNCFDLVNKLYPRLHISAEVYSEVVVAGAGLPGAQQVATSTWIEVTPIHNRAALLAAQTKFGLGVGELSTIVLGKEIHADAVILDDFKARLLARDERFGSSRHGRGSRNALSAGPLGRSSGGFSAAFDAPSLY